MENNQYEYDDIDEFLKTILEDQDIVNHNDTNQNVETNNISFNSINQYNDVLNNTINRCDSIKYRLVERNHFFSNEDLLYIHEHIYMFTDDDLLRLNHGFVVMSTSSSNIKTNKKQSFENMILLKEAYTGMLSNSRLSKISFCDLLYSSCILTENVYRCTHEKKRKRDGSSIRCCNYRAVGSLLCKYHLNYMSNHLTNTDK